jgi:imidazoleglycerol-phosphate dehydratase
MADADRSMGVQERRARVERTTAETRIALELLIDGSGEADVSTGVGFFDHMLRALARHSLVDLQVDCQGDLDVDGHHTVEDVGICLGQALAQAAGDKQGITRFGAASVPMDEALVECVLDFSGRPFLGWHGFAFQQPMVGGFDTSLAVEFFHAVATNAGLTLHLRCHCGHNAHHIIEACFKAFGRACDAGLRYDARVSGVPSTKGTL